MPQRAFQHLLPERPTPERCERGVLPPANPVRGFPSRASFILGQTYALTSDTQGRSRWWCRRNARHLLHTRTRVRVPLRGVPIFPHRRAPRLFPGTPTARVDVDVTVDAVLLSFVWRQTGTSELRRDCQCVPLTWTVLHPLSPHCRGIRPWFLCPEIDEDGQPCGRRVALLYSGRNPYFGCRKCRRLAYASEQENPRDRSLRRARKARLQLRGTLSLLDPLPARPRYMHMSRYNQLWGKALIAAERWVRLEGSHLPRGPGR